jgi:glycosyltransferase involved in cell wall biosynthesis
MDAGAEVKHVDMAILRREYMSGRGLLFLMRTWMRSWRTARRFLGEADLVYINTSASLPMLPMVRRKTPALLHVHEYWRPREAPVLRLLASRCDHVVAVSKAVTVPLGFRLNSKTLVIYNGLEDDPRRAEVGSSEELVALIASRWNEWKGHKTLGEAWRAGIPGMALVILGGPPDSGEAVDVRRVFSASEPAVRILGEIEDVSGVVSSVDLVIVPSDRPDPLPTIALEALRAGVPVVGSAHGGMPEILGEDEAGWLFEPGDAGDLRRVLASIETGELRHRAVAARRRFEDLFEASRADSVWGELIAAIEESS